MNRLLKIIALSIAFSSCSTLDTEPTDFIAPDFFYSNETELNFALSGVYALIRNGILYSGGDGLLTSFNASDEMFPSNPRNGRPEVYNYSSADTWPNTLWQVLYQGIERANMLLANIEKADISEEKRGVIKGEAKFLRAYFYFVLVQNFGGVPLRDVPTASVSDVFYPRTPASEVYDFIYNEMVEAESLVEPITAFNHSGRVTKSAVQGILTRVSLYMAGFPNNNTEKFADALTWATKVIESGNHALNPDYSQVFINLIQNQYDTRECIWEVEFYTTGATDPFTVSGSLGNLLGIDQRILAYGYSGSQYKVHEMLFKKFEPADLRRDWSIAPYRFVINSNPPVKAFWDDSQIYDREVGKYRREYELITDKIQNNTGTNFPLLRYSDVLLMAAEAENEVNGPSSKAYQYVNEVRTRANATPINETLDQQGFRKLIQDERARELCFEGWRRLDLIRWGYFTKTMKELAEYVTQTAPDEYKHAATGGWNVTEQHYYLPIPQRELSLNKLLTQNPGW